MLKTQYGTTRVGFWDSQVWRVWPAELADPTHWLPVPRCVFKPNILQGLIGIAEDHMTHWPPYTIWKYKLRLEFNTTIVWEEVIMPQGAEVVSTHAGYGHDIFIWARVDTNAPPVPRQFAVCGTGRPIPPEAKFIGTVKLSDNSFAHVVEK